VKKTILIALALSPLTSAAELSIPGLDLKMKGMGYRWVQDLESGEDNNGMRLFTQLGITESIDLRIGWNRMGINTPLDNGHDSIMFEFFQKLD
jgi:hypothetical protein